VNPDEVADRDFPVVMRGYAREDVDAFLATVADQIAERDARLARLEVEVQRLRTAAPASLIPPVDRRTLIGQLGEEAASILAAADASAQRIKADALGTAERVRLDLRSIAGSLGDVHQLLGELVSLIHGLAEGGQAAADLRVPEFGSLPVGGDLPGQEVRTIFGEVLGLDSAAPPAEIHLPAHDSELRRFS